MLENEYYVFTGTLTTMTRKQAQSIIIGLKGHNQNAVTKKTTRLVTGNFPIDLIKGYHHSHKISEAKQSKRKGQRIMIMTEKEFIEFLAKCIIFLCETILLLK